MYYVIAVFSVEIAWRMGLLATPSSIVLCAFSTRDMDDDSAAKCA